MTLFLRHLELCLTLTGVAVIVAVFYVLEPTGESSWRTVAGVATTVCVGQGLVAWCARRHRHKQRDAALRAAQALLTRIVDQEQAISARVANRCETDIAVAQVACAGVARLVTAISDALQTVSSGSLRPQHADYADKDSLTGDRAPAD